MSDAIQALRSHSPLSSFDRDLKRYVLHIEHEKRIQRIAWVIGAAVYVLVLAAIALGAFGIVSWRTAGMGVGGGAFLLGLCRYGANALLHGWTMRQYKLHLPLSEADKQALQLLVEQSRSCNRN